MEAASAAAVASAAASEDLHASLEANLRASRADVGRLQSELKRLQAAASAAALMTNPVMSPSSRDAPSLEQAKRVQSQLEASETRCSLLQEEVAQLKAAAATASKEAATADAASPVSRDGSQTASSSGRNGGMQGSLQNGVLHGDVTCMTDAELNCCVVRQYWIRRTCLMTSVGDQLVFSISLFSCMTLTLTPAPLTHTRTSALAYTLIHSLTHSLTHARTH